MPRSFARALALVAIAALALPGVAFADNVVVDGDGLVPVATNALAFGNVCQGLTPTRTILLEIDAAGHPGKGTNVFADGATVSFTRTPPPGITASKPTDVTLPADWTSLGNSAISATTSSTVGLTAAATATLGSGTGSVEYSATGNGGKDGTLTKTTTLSVSWTVVVCDVTPPTLSLPANITAEAAGPAGATVTYTATASDANPTNPAVTCDYPSGATFSLGTTTVTCSATDAAKNTATGSFQVTVRDSTAPAFSATANVTVEAQDAQGALATYVGPTATDAVGPASPAVTCIPASGSLFAVGVSTVDCSATDAAGNTGHALFTVKVQDTTAPILAVPSTVTAEATGPSGAAVEFTATGSDLVDGTFGATCTPPSGSMFALGMTTVSCSAADAAGNEATGSFNVTVVDTLPPDISNVPTNITKEATGPSGAPATWDAPTALDLVDGSVTVSCDATPGVTFPLGITTVHCVATDTHGNVGNASFTITVQDTTPPIITGTVDLVVEATGPSGATASFTPTAVDIVDGMVAVECDHTSGATFAIGSTTVRCSAEDSHSNKVTAIFVVTVRDTTPPAITVPAPITAEATGPDGAAVEFSATAVDLVDGAVGVTCAPAAGSTFALGETPVLCSATDTHGNGGEKSFTVTVVDTTAPVIANLPANITAEATGPDGASVAWTAPTAKDLVDGDVPVICDPASGGAFPIDVVTEVTCSATDKRDNRAENTFRVAVVDTTPPAISGISADIVREATGHDGAAAEWVAPAAIDLVDGAVAVDCVPVSGSTFGFGATLVVCSATDAHRNKAENKFSVTVQDTTAPAITVPANLTLEATGPNGAIVTYESATATDIVDGAVPATCSPASGEAFDLGINKVTCSATDTHENTGTATFTITIVDTTAPVISGAPANMEREATGPGGAAATWELPTASDLVDGSVAVACDHASGSTFTLGVTTVKCSATDAHNNRSQVSFTITVVDTSAPSLTLPATFAVPATGPAGAVVSFEASASDIVDGSIAAACTPASGGTFPLGWTTVNCSATDKAGNKATGSFKVQVTLQLGGFFQPVDMNGILNTVKGGSTVPLKFRLFAGSTELTSTSYVKSFTTKTISCSALSAAQSDDIEFTTTGGTTLRYDTTGGQFIQNWQTPKSSGVCYQATMITLDGSQIFAFFKTK